MNFLKFLFYKSYRLAISLGNEGFYPEINAWFLTTLLVWGNIASVLILLKYYLVISKSIFKIMLYAAFILWVLTFIYFIKGGNYKLILEEIQKETLVVRKRKSILTWIYTIFSLVIYLYLSDI